MEIDQITDLIPVMEAAMLEELEDLQNAAAVTANLLQQTSDENQRMYLSLSDSTIADNMCQNFPWKIFTCLQQRTYISTSRRHTFRAKAQSDQQLLQLRIGRCHHHLLYVN